MDEWVVGGVVGRREMERGSYEMSVSDRGESDSAARTLILQYLV